MSHRKPPGTSGTTDDVGYGRPPRQHQFKPGQSGNRNGRPKGSKNEATIIDQLLNRKIEIRENGRARNITVLEGIHLKFAEDALKGNPKSAAFLLNRRQLLASSSVQPADAVLDMDDRKVLEAFARQLQDKRNPQGDPE